MKRGAICWADLGTAFGSGPSKRRPILVVQSDPYLQSRISTATVVAITSNTRLAEIPGNVFVPSTASALGKDSVINVSQVITIDCALLESPLGQLPPYLMAEVDAGLRRALGL